MSTGIAVHDLELALYSHLNTLPYFTNVSPPNDDVILLSGAPTSSLLAENTEKQRFRTANP